MLASVSSHVGRSVGRSGGCAGVGVPVSQCAESPVPRETPWKLKAPRVEEATCDPLLTSALSEAEWSMVGELMPRFIAPYTGPEGEWSTMLPLDHGQREWQKYCHLCGKGATPGHLATDTHNKGINNWKRQGCPQLVITPEKFTDNRRLEMTLQAYLPNFTEEQIRVAKERVLQEQWYR